MKFKPFFILIFLLTEFLYSQEFKSIDLQFLKGEYYNENCEILVIISEKNGEFYYDFKSRERNLKGNISVDVGDDNVIYGVLEEIEYSEDYFDVALPDGDKRISEYEKLQEKGERRIGVDFLFENGEFVIQNYGNAMNYYVKLYDCDEKYIYFKKIKND